ncbi:MAG: hypothetical protein KAS96_01155 [Planctomycetes bacterium]|nr:hypothetical protein [Planctomycetota bacterium]
MGNKELNSKKDLLTGILQDKTTGGDDMIMKGGSYWNYHTSCRTFSRFPLEAAGAGGDRGFRLVVNCD